MALTEGWAAKEMQGARLDTPRRLPNLILACEKLHQNAGKSLSAALGDATRQAAFDLFSRSGRTVDDLLAGHVAQTKQRCLAAPGAVYLLQDSVRLDYFTHRGCVGLGPVGCSPDSYGLWGHSALVVGEDGLPFGVLGLQFWTRDPETFGQRHQRHERAAEEKETRVWGETLTAVEKALPAEVPLILVQDRGADLYPFFVQERRPNTHFVVRAYQPRRARLLPGVPEVPERDAAGGDGQREPGGENPELTPVPSWVALPQAWKGAPVRVEEVRVQVQKRPATPKKPALEEREAVVEVRSARVEIARPQSRQGRQVPERTTQLWAVWVREKEPPAGAEAVEWLLLTTLPAGTATEAQAVVAAYERRWMVERLHRVLKSGLRVERFQVDDATTLKNVLAVCWIVAWQILRLTEAARVEPEAAAEEWLAPEEMGVLEAQFGAAPKTLREGLRLVAKFGGWPGATKKRMPGTDVLWRGLRDLAVAVRVWRLARQGLRPLRDTS